MRLLSVTLKRVIRLVTGFVYLAIFLFLALASPMLGGYKPVVVLSGSMEPVFKVGSVIYYKSSTFNEINEGDAITFLVGDSTFVTHRVVRKNEVSRTFVTKGDANNTVDPNPVSFDRVAGKVINLVIPFAGYLVIYGQTLQVILFMAAIIVIDVLWDNLQYRNKNNMMPKGNQG